MMYHLPLLISTFHQETKAHAEVAKQRGSEYLASKYMLISDPLQLAMTAYALDVANHREKDNAYYRLRTFNRTCENC